MPSSAKQYKLRIDLNLLHPKEIPAKLPERFLKWLISYGRFIVILVEIVVVGAFVTRFKLDADLDGLKIKIKQDLPYIEGRATDEALITQTQNKLALIDKTYQGSDTVSETIIDISSQTPDSIIFTSLLVEEKDEQNMNFRINAATQSNLELGIFLNNLKSLENFRDINLASISFDNDQIVFSVTGYKLKQ